MSQAAGVSVWACGLALTSTLFSAGPQVRPPAPPEPGTASDSASAFVAQVSSARLRASVRDLVALGPRMGGTPSGDAAAAYVERAFQQLGLDTQVVTDPVVTAYQAERWEVRLASGVELTSAWPFRFSPAVDPATTGDLVDIRTLSGAAAERWRGRLVYTQDVSAEVLSAAAADSRPPVAVLASAGTDALAPDWLEIGAVDQPPARAVPVFALNKEDARLAAAAAARGQSASVSLVAQVRRAAPRTVLATLPGRRTGRYYLISAHGDSDSGGPGADDNASGVAALLELARVLSASARSAGGRVLPFSVRFAIWGVEAHSSRAYIDRAGLRLEDCLGVINVDEVGMGAEREAIYAEGNDVPWNRDLLKAFETIGRARRGQDGFWPEFATTPVQGSTDAYSFLPPRYMGTASTSLQMPSVTVFTAAWNRARRLTQPAGWMVNTDAPGRVITDYSRVYHTAGDVPEYTTEREPQNMVRAVRLIALTLQQLAAAEP